MPLHLITGRATAGKSGEVNARLFDSLDRGEQPVLIVPSVADQRRAIAELAAKRILGITVTPFVSWADGLWRLYGDGRRIVSDVAREALAAQAIREAHLTALEAVAATPGLARLVARVAATMTDESAWGEQGTPAVREFAEVCRLYADSIRCAGLIERTAAWKELVASPPRLRGVLAFNRFIDFDDDQITLITGLAQDNDVVVAISWEADFAPTRAADPAVTLLRAAATTVSHLSAEGGEPSELTLLADGLYTPGTTVRPSGRVRCAEAGGSEAEVTLVAEAAAAQIAEGTPPERLVIAFPRLDAQLHRLEAALARHGVPYEVDLARPVAATPLGRSLDALLALACGSGGRSDANAFLLGPHSDASPADAVKLDREWRRRRVTDPSALLSAIGKLAEAPRSRAAASGVASMSRRPVTAESREAWQVLVDNLLAGRLEGSGVAADMSATDASRALEADAPAARTLLRLIAEMSAVSGTPFGLQDVRAALRRVVAGGTAGESPGKAQVTELARLRSRRFDVVIIGGMTASELPVDASESLHDDLRNVFSSSSRAGGEDLARLEFYHAITRARNKLVLVRRMADDEGAAVRPSVLWEEVVDAYREPGEDVEEWPTQGPDRVRLTAADSARSAPAFTEGRAGARRDAQDGRCDVRPAARGRLDDAAVRGALAATSVFSATEIEAYLACPYRWFYERVVRPEEIDAELDARVIGNLSHGLLSAFYSRLNAELGVERVTPGRLEESLALFARIRGEMEPEVRADGLAEELSRARAERWVETAIRDDALALPGFAPEHHELAFGGEGGPDVVVGGVRFRGRIDRIDVSDTAVFVTDYKSSRQVSGHEKFAEEGKVQAIVYAQAAEGLLGAPVAGSVYRSLRSRSWRGFWRTDLMGGAPPFSHERDGLNRDEAMALFERTEASIAEAVAGMRAGRIPRAPTTRGACVFCALKPQCEEAV